MRGSFISSSDTDFINSSLKRLSAQLEETSIQKRDYQSLITSTASFLASF